MTMFQFENPLKAALVGIGLVIIMMLTGAFILHQYEAKYDVIDLQAIDKVCKKHGYETEEFTKCISEEQAKQEVGS